MFDNDYSVIDVMKSTIDDIVNGVNAGQCKEFKKAKFIVSYPPCLVLYEGDNRPAIGIYRVKQVERYVNGYIIEYIDGLDDKSEDIVKRVTVTLTRNVSDNSTNKNTYNQELVREFENAER